ncbi:MAG: acyltransferase [Cyanobacteria bacterium J06573_11]
MLASLLRSLYYSWRRKKQRLNKVKQLHRPTFIHIEAVFKFPEKIEIGRYCRIGKYCNIDGEGGVTIGDGTLLAPHVTLLSSSHQYDQQEMLPYSSADKALGIVIGRGCWIGWGAMVAPGVVIGDGAVVGMGAVVTKNVEAGSVVVGNPAKAVKQRDIAFVQQAVENEHFYLKLLSEKQIARSGRAPDKNQHFWVY